MVMAPDFFKSKYFVSKPEWHLLPEAPDSLKKEFERYYNNNFSVDDEDENGNKIENPYFTWEGKVISKK